MTYHPTTANIAVPRTRADRFVPLAVIGSHAVQHAYGQGFLVILPAVYAGLGLGPLEAGLIDSVRRLTGGITSMGGGLVVDRLQRYRSLMLALALGLMGVGYFLAAVAPSYLLLVLAFGLATGAGSLWHPPALSILSQRFPGRRGLLIALHRASGSIGDTAGPLLVGVLLRVADWRGVLQASLVPAGAVAVSLALILRLASGASAGGRATASPSFRVVLGSLVRLFRAGSLPRLMVVAGLRGMADNALLVFLPLYLSEVLRLDPVTVGFHVSLLTGLGIVSGPLLGALSDWAGRKWVVLGVMGVSALLAAAMGLVGQGVGLTVLVGLMGSVLYAANPILQAAAMDIADGLRLEGSMIGLMWGNNALFGAISPLILGLLAQSFGLGVVFWYALVLYLAGALLTVTL